MIFLFLVFSALLVYFSFRSFLGGVAFLPYFREQLVKPANSFTPFATVIAPCKGIDDGLEENLAALFELDYPEYEIIFVVDDENDPAVSVIERFLTRPDECEQDEHGSDDAFPGSDLHPVRHVHSGRLVFAPKATDSGQKVENIREGVHHADSRSYAFVFVDSDARPQRNWLKDLVTQLEDESVGVSTGYRWFVSKKMTFASELRSAWNASIASALGPDSAFCWAGSMAIRREVWERLDLSDRLKGTLADDFVIASVIKNAGLIIRLVPSALTPSIETCTLRELFEFTTRQMKITRVYATPLWLISFFGSGLFSGVMLSALLIVLFSRSNDLLVWSAIATLVAVSILSIGKAWLRLKAVSLVIPKASRQSITQLTLWLLASPLFLWNCIAALLSRTIVWRGIRYRLVSPRQTDRLN